MKKSFITTPIYYASGNLHIGHLYTTTLAWVIANYKKMQGYDVKLLTGSDEHGLKIQQKAAELKLEPQTLVDTLSQKYIQMWKDFEIDYDYFWRTSNFKHKQIVQKIFSYFLDKGYVYKGVYKGLYSISDEEFLTEAQAVKKDGKLYHPVSQKELEWISEESYFFDMKKFEPWLKNYISNHDSWLMPLKTKKEIITNFIEKGLSDLSVTRTNIKWGISVLEDPKHTLYVWLDALCNYISALGFNFEQSQREFKEFWNSENSEIIHLVGKEITRFHMIYWPIFLKALDLKQPTRIQSHGWILDKNGYKMSKSLNNIVDPYDLLFKYHPEIIKYFLASQINFGEDGFFDEERLIDIVNADLVNNFGNLISRTLKMKDLSFQSKNLNYQKTDNEWDLDIQTKILNALNEYIANFDDLKIDKALKVAINLSNTLNKYIDLTKPWTLKQDLKKLEQILVRLLNGIYAVALMLQVVMPKKMAQVAKALGASEFILSEVANFEKFSKLKQETHYILFERIKR